MQLLSITVLAVLALGASTAVRGTSTVQDTSYVAAVVEYRMSKSGSTPAIQLSNRITDYVKLIEKAATQSVDIIVFPEASLTADDQPQVIPEASEKVTPCGNTTGPYATDGVLARLSCAVRDAKLYALVNLRMSRKCDAKLNGIPCGNATTSVYNTNIVFDRNGTIISVYRKVNLFGELGITTTAVPDIASFKTDFGVEFGHFTCFDLLFPTPANQLLERNIRNFAYPTKWFSQLPYLSALQAQQGWAYARDANLLASGHNQAETGTGGSGIFAGRAGALRRTVTDKSDTQLIVNVVQKVPPTLEIAVDAVNDPISIANFVTFVDDTPYTYAEVKEAVGGMGEAIIQLNGERCTFNYNLTISAPVTGASSYEYAWAMYNSNRTFAGNGQSTVRLCSLVACINASDKNTCGKRFSGDTRVYQRYAFRNLQITGSFKTLKTNLTMPDTLNENLLPLQSRDFGLGHETNATHTNVTINLKKTNTHHLITFGIYSADHSAAVTQQLSGIIIMFALAFWSFV